MTLSDITLFVVSVSNFILGFFVFSKHPRDRIKISYFLFALGISGWALTNGIFQVTTNYVLAFVIAILAYYAGVLIALPFFYFTLVFPKDYPNINKFHNYLVLIWATIWVALIALPDVTLRGIIEGNPKGLVTGPGLYFHFISIALLMFGGIANLVYKAIRSKGEIRLQILYVLFGVILMTVFGILFNLVLPLTGNYSFVWLGPIFSVFVLASTAYAIVRHRLMGIEVIIRLGTIYAILFATVTYLYTYLATLVGEYVPGSLTYIIPSILITFGFVPLKNLIETITDKVFFRKTYSVQTIINQLNNIINESGLDLDQLLEKFNQIIVEFIRVEHAAILLLTPQEEFVSRHAFAGNKRIILGRNHRIVEHIYKYPDKLIDKERMGDEMHREITEELKRLHASLVIPIEVKGQVIGLYLLGEKKSQDSFTDEEIDLLRLIATESGSSIDNARLFEELKKIDEVKSKFISIISHQLRTPLTSIRWNLELLLQENFDKKTKDELFEHSYQGALNMAKNLDELFTALDIEEKGIIPKIKVEQADFHELLKEAMKEIDREAKEKKLNVDISFPDELPILALDKERVSRILAILLKNAVAYSNPDHEINVVGMIEIKNNAKYFVCSVRDQGIGLTPDDEKGIFTRFYRGEEAKKHSPNGSGLGLFVAKYLVNLHHGEIWYTSHGPNKGATFSFSLPIA